MLGRRSIVVVALLALICCARYPAAADVYKREGFSFEVRGLALKEVQDSVASTLAVGDALGVIHDLQHPHWQTSPCYIPPSPDPGGAGAVSDLVARIDSRLGLTIAPCVQSHGPAIGYFESDGETVDAAGRDQLRKLDGNAKTLPTDLADFADGKEDCSWDFSAKAHEQQPVVVEGITIQEPPDILISAGVVALNRKRLGSNVERCLFLGTVSVLGLGLPVAFVDLEKKHGPIDWQTQVEVNLLALFVLNVVIEDGPGSDSEALDAKVRHVLWAMHELGKS
jgi:hypothetical protein